MAKKETYISKKKLDALTWDEIKKMNESELRAVARSYRKRIDTLNKGRIKAGFDPLNNMPASKKETKTSLLLKINSMRTDISTETSGIRKWKKTAKTGIEKALKTATGKNVKGAWKRTGELVIGDIVLLPDELAKFWRMFHDFEQQNGIHRGSDTSASSLKEVIDSYKDSGGSFKKFKEKLNDLSDKMEAAKAAAKATAEVEGDEIASSLPFFD